MILHLTVLASDKTILSFSHKVTGIKVNRKSILPVIEG